LWVIRLEGLEPLWHNGCRHVDHGRGKLPLAGMRTGDPPWHPGVMVRCLIVDDSRRFLDAARGLLESQGMAVVGVASTGAEALRQVEELRPDVTLVDLDLGGESGFEVARRLEHDGGQSPPRMILISTHDEQDYADLIEASPAVGFLPKSALSAAAIRRLLDRDAGPGASVSEPRDT
jgi:CheY-like chemotaxis protein